MSLVLDRDLVSVIEWPSSGRRSEIMRPRTRVKLAEAIDPETGETGRPELVSTVDEGTSLAGRTLADLGVPPYDIVRVDGEEGTVFLRLDGDRDRVMSADANSPLSRSPSES